MPLLRQGRMNNAHVERGCSSGRPSNEFLCEPFSIERNRDVLRDSALEGDQQHDRERCESSHSITSRAA